MRSSKLKPMFRYNLVESNNKPPEELHLLRYNAL
jgi:hypothetical protein